MDRTTTAVFKPQRRRSSTAAGGLAKQVPPLPEGYVQVERIAMARYEAHLVARPGEDDAVSCISPQSPRLRRSRLHADYDVYGALHSELAISLNDADFEANLSTPFEFYDPPGGLSLSVGSGPVLGGTPIVISGGNLTGGTDRRCRFTPMVFGMPTLPSRLRAWRLRIEVAASVLPEHSALRCVTPALPDLVARVTVEVSLNGQQFTREGTPFVVEPKQGEPPLNTERGARGKPPGALAFVPDVARPDHDADEGFAVFPPEPWELETGEPEMMDESIGDGSSTNGGPARNRSTADQEEPLTSVRTSDGPQGDLGQARPVTPIDSY